MLEADKNLLSATLTVGILEIQQNLVQLYLNNLNAVATQTALFCAFSFTGLFETIIPHDYTYQYALAFFYYFFQTVAVTVGLFAIAQATIVTIGGPAMALKGETPEAVTHVVKIMKNQQNFVVMLFSITLGCIFGMMLFWMWIKRPIGIATINTVILLVMYGLIVYSAKNTSNEFDSLGGKISVMGAEEKEENDAKIAQLKKDTQIRARGSLWMRQSVSKGGNMGNCFAVLENGQLDMYKKEEEYSNHQRPINQNPFKLSQYKIVTDYSKFYMYNVSTNSSVLGRDFSIGTLLTSNTTTADLNDAARRYKFLLVPTVSSELSPLDIAELMAEDKEAYDLWIAAFSKITNAFNELHKLPTVDSTMRANADIETVVRVANRD